MFLISKTVSIARAYQSSPQDLENYCCLEQFASGRLLRKDLSLISAVQKWLFDDNKRLSWCPGLRIWFCPVATAHQHKWCLSFGYYNSLWLLKFIFLILFLMLFTKLRTLASHSCFESEWAFFSFFLDICIQQHWAQSIFLSEDIFTSWRTSW